MRVSNLIYSYHHHHNNLQIAFFGIITLEIESKIVE